MSLSDPGPGMINLPLETLCWGCGEKGILSFTGRWVVFQPPSEVYRVFCDSCLDRFARGRSFLSLLVVSFEEWVENNRRRRWWDDMQDRVIEVAGDAIQRLRE